MEGKRECGIFTSPKPHRWSPSSPVRVTGSTQKPAPENLNNHPEQKERQPFMSLGQCSGVFVFVSTVDPGLQELQRWGPLGLMPDPELRTT
uniref:SFRICE_032442 n=1 Tax=Spodoptera frugiperda TaxID=7108 RepID=A0A2H1WYL4_SPOFR